MDNSSSTPKDPAPPKRHLPVRNRRLAGAAIGSEIDQNIIEVHRLKGSEELLDPKHTIRLTTDGSYSESSVDGARIVHTAMYIQYYGRPEVIESYRQQKTIATPDYVDVIHTPAVGSRFRPREIDKIIVDDSDLLYEKRHKKHDAAEKRTRLRELESLEREHHKLKARIDQLKALDSSSFMTLPADSFSPPPVAEEGVDEMVIAHNEGERRRKEMLEAAHILEGRYRVLLPLDRKTSKKVTKPAPVDQHVEVGGEEEIPLPAVPPPELVERPTVSVPNRRKTSTPSSSEPSPSYSKPNAAASGSMKRGRSYKNANSLANLKEKNPDFTSPQLPTPPPPPAPTSSPPTSSRAYSHAGSEFNGTETEVSDLRTPLPPPAPAHLARIITAADAVASASTPPSYAGETLTTEETEEFGESRPRKRVKTTAVTYTLNSSPPPPRLAPAPPPPGLPCLPPPSPYAPYSPSLPSLPSPPFPAAALPSPPSPPNPRSASSPALQSPCPSALHSLSPLPPPRAPSLPPIEYLSMVPALSSSRQAPVSTRRGAKSGPRAKARTCAIMQVAQRYVGTREKTPRHIIAFGVKLPAILANTGDVYEYELPDWVMEPDEPDEGPSSTLTMTGRIPDGDESDNEEGEKEKYEPPPLLPIIRIPGRKPALKENSVVASNNKNLPIVQEPEVHEPPRSC